MRRRSSVAVLVGTLLLLAGLGAASIRLGEGSSPAILWDLRLPRVLLAACVGASLAVSGAIFQGLFRNPLADPFVLGVSGGSALGAVVGIVLRVPARLGIGGVPALAFGGGLGAALLVYRLARVRGRTPLATLLLAGFAVGSMASAFVTLLLVANAGSWGDLLLWLMGSLHHPDAWERLKFLAPATVLALAVAAVHARDLNVFLLGEESAQQLGVDVERAKLRLLLAASVAASAAVAAAGMIGFVGLVVPNLLRRVVGPDHRDLLPVTALGGALLVVAADLAARTLMAPAELPIGALWARAGGPFPRGVPRGRRAGGKEPSE